MPFAAVRNECAFVERVELIDRPSSIRNVVVLGLVPHDDVRHDGGNAIGNDIGNGTDIVI